MLLVYCRLSCASFQFHMCFVQVFRCCIATKRTLNPLSHRYACSSAKVYVCVCVRCVCLVCGVCVCGLVCGMCGCSVCAGFSVDSTYMTFIVWLVVGLPQQKRWP